MEIPITTPEQQAGIDAANEARKRLCEQVLLQEKVKKEQKQTTVKPIRRTKK